MVGALRTFLRRTEGAHLVEYSLLVAVVAVAAIAGLTDLLGGVNSLLQPVIDTLGGVLP